MNEESIEKEILDIETVKYLIRSVQQNRKKAINDDSDVEVTGGKNTEDFVMSENAIASLKFYNGVEGCIIMEKFQIFLPYKDLEDI